MFGTPSKPSQVVIFVVAQQKDLRCNIRLVFDHVPNSTKEDVKYTHIEGNKCYIKEGNVDGTELINTEIYGGESWTKYYAAVADLLGDSVQIYNNDQHIATMYYEGESIVIFEPFSPIDWDATKSIYNQRNYQRFSYNPNKTKFVFEFKTTRIE